MTESVNKIYTRAFEIAFTSETVRLWNGNVNRKLYDNNVILGLKGQIDAPAIPFSPSADNDTSTFTIYGLPARFDAMMWDEKAEVIGNNITEYAVFLNEDLTYYDHKLAQVYTMAGIQSQRVAGTASGQPTYNLSIMVETLFAGRAEAGFGRYTQADQIGRYPEVTDNMLNFVSNLARGIKFKLA